MNQQMDFSLPIEKSHSKIDQIIVKLQNPRWISAMVIENMSNVSIEYLLVSGMPFAESPRTTLTCLIERAVSLTKTESLITLLPRRILEENKE